MLCDKCKKNQATTHISSTVNGIKIEKNLCSHCAAEEGFSEFGGGLFNMFSTMLGEANTIQSNNAAERCKLCGKTFDDIARSGRLGCACCYNTFAKQLSPSLKRIHGSIKHIGKRSKCGDTTISPEKEIHNLKSELQKAVEAENYEKAAELRDKIKGLEAR